MNKRKNNPEKAANRQSGSPDDLVAVAAQNKAFAERLIGVYRIALSQSGGQHGRR